MVLLFSCLVVFVTTYLLIMPAFTLDKEEAAEQGGIDVPGVEQSAEADTANTESEAKEDAVSEAKEEKKTETSAKTDGAKPANDLETEGKASPKVTLQNDESDDFVVAVEGKDAGLSEDMSVAVREIDQSNKKQKEEYESLYNDALEAVQKAQKEEGFEKSTEFAFAKFYDISLMDGRNEVEPDSAVDVKISFSKKLQKELEVTDPDGVHIVHFAVDKETGEVTPEVLDTETTDITVKNNKVTEAAFTADSFSVYAVVYTVVIGAEDDGVYSFEGKDYTITITCPEEANIPAGTKLTVSELDPDSDEYIQRLGQAWYEVNREYFEVEEKRANYDEGMGDLPDLNLVNLDSARFFDISFEYNGNEIEPSEAVNVEISYDKGLKALGDCEPVSGVAHFGKDSVELIKDVETETDENGGIVSFKYEQSSFSDTGTYVGQETYDAKNKLKQASAPVYDPENAITLSPSGNRDGSGSDLPAPASSKTLTPNKTDDGQNDGTYTLTLSVAGSSKSTSIAEVNRSNVLIVMDRSSSMVNNKVKIYTPYNGKPKNNVTYYGKEGDSYFQLFTNDGKYYKTRTQNWGGYSYSDRYTGQVYTATEGDRRLDAEQAALSSLISELLAKNNEFKQDSEGYLLDDNNNRVLDKEGHPIKVNDIIEMSVISFADRALGNYPRNDGVGSAPNYGTEVDWTTNYNTLMAGVNKDNAPSGTNWEDALKYAKYIADTKHAAQPDEPVFIVFLTDGEPTAIAGETGGAHHYTNQNGTVGEGFEKAYVPAKDDARALVTSGYEFYGIFTYGEGEAQVGYLKRLVNVAYGHADNTTQTDDLTEHFHDAGDDDALLAAFEHILSKISGTLAVGNVTVSDGLTTDATTSTLVSGQAGGFRYSVTGPLGELYSATASGSDSDPTVTFAINGQNVPGTKKIEHVTRNQVDDNGNPVPDPNNPGKYLTVTEDKTYYSASVGTTEYKMALANIDSKGQITWDLSAVGTLMSGYTYSCSFVVWPDQEAYDYVAGLNNGLANYEWNQDSANAVRDENGDVVYWTGGVTTGGPDGNGYPSIVKYPNGTFAVLTNTNQSVTYSIVDTKTDETTGETETTYDGPYTKPLEQPDPMPLTGTDSQLEKVWNIDRDPSILYKYLYESKDEDGNPVPFDIGFEIKQDGAEYKTLHLPGEYTVTAEGVEYDWSACDAADMVEYKGKSFSRRWTQEFSIPTGLMLTEAQMDARKLDKEGTYTSYSYNGTTYYVLEDGHDFTISEPSVGYEFDFDNPTYHPMLVDGVLMDVKFSTEGGVKKISGMEPLEIDAGTGKSALRVFNTLRGYINLNKIVVDHNNEQLESDNTEFTYEVELTNDFPVFEGDHIPWYGVTYGTKGLYYHDADGNYYQAEYVNGELKVTTEEGGPYPASAVSFNPDFADEQTVTYTVDGESKTVTISGNQMTPSEGSYSDGYKKVTATVKITQKETLHIANVPVNTQYSIREITDESPGYKLVSIVSQVGSSGLPADAGNINTGIVGGEITPNEETHITYTNKCQVTDITIQKVDEKGNGLEGAIFELYSVGETGLEETPATNIKSVGGLQKTLTKVIDGREVTFQSAIETTGEIQKISGLPDGTYRLREKHVPAGYISTYKYIEFEISNRTVVEDSIKTDAGDTDKLDFTEASGNTLALLKITNEPGVELPHTGGMGTTVFYIFGTVLTLGCALTLISRRRLQKNN